MEQWHLARARSPPDSPPSSSDTSRQVVVSRLEATERVDANPLHLRHRQDAASSDFINLQKFA